MRAKQLCEVPDVRVVKSIDDVPSSLAALAQDGDLVITLGAGSISATGDRILKALNEVRS